ncbi:FecCD family ABC transporter permease [Celerinatantimonas yamalensis]|uniref:Iron chelate uptake ABC transporter family permease subunit n=1 Tax=Celerinatantimonas yamalensis TaxID=559956 RepID=A0ABW9G2Q5_9GAMM
MPTTQSIKMLPPFRRSSWCWWFALCGLCGAFILHLNIGDYALQWQTLFSAHSNLSQQIFWQLRFPRALGAVLVGAALGGSGSVLQTVLHNPLAEPGLLGISSGASLAAVALMVFAAILGWTLPVWGVMFAALMGALLVAGLLFALARRYQLSAGALLLFGVVIGIIAGAALTWLLYLSPTQNLRQLLYWLMGSLSFASQQVYQLAPIFVVVVIMLARDAKHLNALLLGERHAFALGVDVRRLRPRLVLWVSLLSAIAVACAGTISFIGLLVPHVLRRWLGDEQRQLLWMSMLVGALSVLLADCLALTILPGAELPIGVITATIGGPILFILLIRKPYD